jgi:2-methylcitrate dehydratase PrpD
MSGTVTDELVDFIRTAAPAPGAPSSAGRWPVVTDAVADMPQGAVDKSAAVAVGSAVADAVAAALDSTSTAARWSRQSVAGIIGAAAALGRLMDFDDQRLRHLLGLCATQAAGLRALDDTETGALQNRKATDDAVEAAHLVAHGFTSSAAGLDGRRGLFALMAPGATFGGWRLDDESD